MTDTPDTLPSCLNPLILFYLFIYLNFFLVLFYFVLNAFILIADNVPDSSIMLLM